jgi:hypothetical protein
MQCYEKYNIETKAKNKDDYEFPAGRPWSHHMNVHAPQCTGPKSAEKGAPPIFSHGLISFDFLLFGTLRIQEHTTMRLFTFEHGNVDQTCFANMPNELPAQNFASNLHRSLLLSLFFYLEDPFQRKWCLFLMALSINEWY